MFGRFRFGPARVASHWWLAVQLLWTRDRLGVCVEDDSSGSIENWSYKNIKVLRERGIQKHSATKCDAAQVRWGKGASKCDGRRIQRT